jgi:uncharacterized surface protein with fasciclin (FAS1) repeats
LLNVKTKSFFMRMSFKPTMLKALLAITVGSFAIASCDKMPPPSEGKKTILQTIATDSRFQFLTVAVHRAGLSETLDDKKAELTLFAPTDQAFKDAGFKNINDVATAPVDALKKILLYHVLGSEVKAAQIPLASNTAVNTVGGAPVYATRQANPTRVFINGVKVIQADLDCKNGVIHVIGKVLIPAVGNIVQTAQGNPKLSYLVAAVLRASQGEVNVAAVLSGAGPFTVFAPTNDAFKNAGFATIDAINAAPPSALTPILTYHVIGARIFSSDLTEGAEPATVNGGKVKISLAGGPKVKGKSNSSASNIIITDIVCTNGVVHVIDQVLLP